MQEEEIKNHIRQGQTASKALGEDPGILAAKNLKRQLEAEMGLPADATRAPTEAELNRLNPFWGRDRRGDYTRAAKAVDDLVRTRDFNLNRALELAQKHYQIGITRPVGVVRYNADLPSLGSSWQWTLRFAERREADIPADSDVWISPKAGTVKFLESAFSSPSMLAYKIFHEASHYHLAFANAEYGMLKNEEEVWINKSALRHVADFGLSTNEVRNIIGNTGLMYAISREERRRMGQGQTPITPHGGFGLQPSRLETVEVVRQVDADLAAFDRSLARGVTDEEVEALKAGAQSEFVRDLKTNELWGLIFAWRSARENDAMQSGRDAQLQRERIHEEAAARRKLIEDAAAACGFIMTPEGDFHSQGGSVFRVYHGGDVDRARAAFLLIDACIREGRPDAQPCNDAIGVVSARWQEPKFKDAMMKWRTTDPFIDGVGRPGQCLLELRDKWTPRGDYADLKATIEKNYRDRWARENPPRELPRTERPPREDPAPPPRRGDGQCYWTNDGREICP